MSTITTGVKAMVRRSATKTSKTPTSKRPAAAKKRKVTPELRATRIFFLIDSSGSMAGLANDAIAGFNTYVNDQRELEGDVKLTLTLFDTTARTIYYNSRIENVPLLTHHTYRPNGGTSLYDAVGSTISSYLLQPAEVRAREQVILVVFTDGQENSSREFTYQRVQELIGMAQSEYDWQIMFLGSDLQSVEIARNMGIRESNTTYVSPTFGGLQGAMKSASYGTRAYRGDILRSASGASYSAENLNIQNLYADTVALNAITSDKTGFVGSSTIADLKKVDPKEKKSK